MELSQVALQGSDVGKVIYPARYLNSEEFQALRIGMFLDLKF